MIILTCTMPVLYLCLFLLVSCSISQQNGTQWRVDTAEEWLESKQNSENLEFQDGNAICSGDVSIFQSVLHAMPTRLSASRILVKQSPIWRNWEAIENLGPSNLRDAPVLLSRGPNDYWMFGRYGGEKKKETFRVEQVELDGYSIPLVTTPFLNQFDAPGGLKKGLGGYHAWQSRDLIHWVHHGSVSEEFSRWVTTAEQVNNKTYIYYDYPNDQDPHLYIDDNLEDGLPGENKGLAFRDPSDGSDCAIIRDRQGRFHLIYEDWSPVNAKEHSWDSPLAGHAVSEDGISGFNVLPPVVDQRTHPTGEFAQYKHPHWLQHPDWDSNIARYAIHEPEQNAFGDWSSICVGGQYYLFSDFHPANGGIRLAWFTSPEINGPFEFCGEIGKGHPDPDIFYAEDKFYLVTQLEDDFSSPGPWVGKVEIRVGVDTDRDGSINSWTEWAEIKETYDYVDGFSKHVSCLPATLSLKDLPSGYGFAFELQTECANKSKVLPIFDSICLSF